MCTRPRARYEFYETYENKSGGISQVARFGFWEEWERILERHPNRTHDEVATLYGYNKVYKVPCNSCDECLLNRSKKKAAQLMIENYYRKDPEGSWFITLTYDDEHLPYNEVYDKNGNFISAEESLPPKNPYLYEFKADREKCIKPFIDNMQYHAMSKYGDERPMWFYCAEYGSQTKRPHFHMIVFGMHIPLNELKFYEQRDGYILYEWVKGCEIWKNGFVTVGNFTNETAAYVAGYALKKQSKKTMNWVYQQQGKLPEYTGQSRYPAIGSRYYEEHKDNIYKTDEIYLPSALGVIKLRPISYYDNKFSIENPERMAEIKAKREEIAIQSEKHKMLKTTLSSSEQRRVTANSKKRKREIALAGRTEI